MVPPLLNEEKLTTTLLPLQFVILFGWSTCPVGLTVIVNVFDTPLQTVLPPENEGVTVIVAIIGVFVVFIAVNVGMFPLPEAASPIPVFELVQLYVVPVEVLLVVKLFGVTVLLLQTVTAAGWFTCAAGLTVIM